METEQHIYFFESIDTVSQACHLFSNHTLVYLYSGRLYLRNQCGETLDIERGDSAFIGRDSYSHIYAEPELHGKHSINSPFHSKNVILLL